MHGEYPKRFVFSVYTNTWVSGDEFVGCEVPSLWVDGCGHDYTRK